MELDEFEWAVGELMKNDDLLYSSLSKDLYFLGKVLVKKYGMLRICYNVFMYGLVIAAIAFGIALAMGNPIEANPF